MKRPPTLADKVLAGKHDAENYEPKVVKMVHAALFDARKYVLDQQAAIWFAAAQRSDPNWIADNMEFALQPHPTMWVEFPFRAYFQEITGTFPDAWCDQTVGYLYHNHHAYAFADFEQEGPGMVPIRYDLNRPMGHAQKVWWSEVFHMPVENLDGFAWGSCWPLVSPERRPLLMAQHGWTAIAFKDQRPGDDAKRFWSKRTIGPLMMNNNAGDIRNIVAMLLYLNRTNDIRHEELLPPQQGVYQGKLRTMLSHRVISFKFDPKPRVIRHYGTVGAPRREHDVRGHFCLNHVAREHRHEHLWDEQPGHGHQWKCMQCGGKKWWKDAFRRGKNKAGLVMSEYAVSK